MSERTFIDEIEGKYDLESELEIYLQFLLTDIIKITTYCIKCKKDTENIDPKIVKTKNSRLLMRSKCSDCKNKKLRFVKEQEAECLLCNLGINMPFSKIPLLNVLF